METLFERLQMNDTRDLLGAKMSTGMKQKVSVARTLVHDPPVLIFDEATAGLDVLVIHALLNTVAELRDHGKCIVFSTHIMREAERLCDRDRHPASRTDFGGRDAGGVARPASPAGPGGVVLSIDLATRRPTCKPLAAT